MKRVLVVAALLLIIVIVILVCIKQREPKIVSTTRNGYTVYEIYNLLSPQECDILIQQGKTKGLSESMVWSYETQKGNSYDSNHRKSKQTWLMDAESKIASKISHISEQLTKIPMSNQEALQVAMYEPNGRFNEHYDACYFEDKEYCAKMNNNAGERRSTLLIYLNDTFEGGETEFTKVDIKVKPQKGKAILFWNTDDNEVIIPESMHRGNQVVKGEKWIATKWSHQKEYKHN